MVRGRPYSSDLLVKELRLTETLSAFMAFSWNVLLPVGFLLLSVMEYKKSHSNELFHQRNILSLSHMSNWPLWVKQVGGLLQVSLLILLPCVALVQIYIYLSRGPRDVLEVSSLNFFMDFPVVFCFDCFQQIILIKLGFKHLVELK